MINNSIEQLLRIQDSTQNEQLVFAAGVASAVNYLHITNAATGTGPIFAALGDDSDVDLRIRQKGDASIIFADEDGFEELLVLTQVAGAAQNYVEITNALTAVGPTIAAQGQTDVDLNIASKGTGVINLLDIVVIPDQVTLQVGTFTDAQRPAAGTTGRVIFNTDDGQLNIDDGTNWTLPDGTTT